MPGQRHKAAANGEPLVGAPPIQFEGLAREKFKEGERYREVTQKLSDVRFWML